MPRMTYLQLWTVLCLSFLSMPNSAEQSPRKVYREKGDLVIGGLIPLHNFDESTERCAERRDIGALRLVESMVFSISRANETLLGDLTLGYEIYDTCSSSSETLRNALEFTRHLRAEDNILGVVGPQRSSSSIQATKLLGLYDIPVVSYLSTSDELSNSGKYPYFFRTVPPDKFQVKVIVDILMNYNWTYVSFIYSDDTYGQTASTEFLGQTESIDICIGYSEGIPPSATSDAFNNTLTHLKQLKEDTFLSVVVLFIHQDMARSFFSLAHKQGIHRDFIWIGSDGWGNYDIDPVKGIEDTALGAFTIVPKSGDLPDFDNYFRNASLTSDNPWLDDFAEEVDACRSNVNRCGNDGERPHFESMVSDAVGVYVQALSSMTESVCSERMPSAECVTEVIRNRPRFREFLMDISFHSPSNGLLEFTSSGDAVGRYHIRQLQLVDNDAYKFTVIGNWSNDGISVKQSEWYLNDDERYTENGELPKSVCNEPCGPREIIIPKDCCWLCAKCEQSQIIEDNVCVSCYAPENGSYKWPSEDGSFCVPLPHLKISNKPETIVIIVLSLVALLLELFVLILYIKNRNEKLIRASSRELCFIILVGIFLTSISSMVHVIPSNIYSCIFLRIVPYIALSLIYVPIATMTIRLHRIFQAGRRSTKRPKFISPASQIILTLALTMIPVVWSSVWITLAHPVVIKKKEALDGIQFIEDSCSTSYVQLIGNMAWHFVIVSICCYFAVETRNLPANYNQSRFIAFAAFSTLVVFIAFTPAYFFSSDARARDLYSALGGLLQSMVVLILLFMIKLYAVYFVDEENQVAVTTTRTQRTEEEMT